SVVVEDRAVWHAACEDDRAVREKASGTRLGLQVRTGFSIADQQAAHASASPPELCGRADQVANALVDREAGDVADDRSCSEPQVRRECLLAWTWDEALDVNRIRD